MNIRPLRKRKIGGELYTRRTPTIQYIEESLLWPFDDLLVRASIRDRRHSNYVPSEVLVYYLRQTKSDNSDGRFIKLYHILRDRIEAACPRANRQVGNEIHIDAGLSEIRHATVDHVTELMFTDRQDYDEQLDIYEVVFDKAVRAAHITKLRKVSRRENANEVMEDQVTGEVRAVVEAALERYRKVDLSAEEDLDYRIHLRDAINAMPAQSWQPGKATPIGCLSDSVVHRLKGLAVLVYWIESRKAQFQTIIIENGGISQLNSIPYVNVVTFEQRA